MSGSLSIGTAQSNDLRLTDASVSRFHLELRPSIYGVEVLDHGSTNGTYCGRVRLDRGTVSIGSSLQVGKSTLLVREGTPIGERVQALAQIDGICGRSPVMLQLMSKVRRAALQNTSALIVGESGTGKELIAQSLHNLSPRKSGPFVIVDCASLTPTLVASEIFGHERGAFTGADRQRKGAIERAHGGTLFLDEIGELPENLQPMLLGCLERRTVQRLGGNHPFPVDIRVISATHRDLRVEVNQRRFRLDLYYRLAVIRLEVPPLRERPDDIPFLVDHFLHQLGMDGKRQLFSEQEMTLLQSHTFRGNVRELRNIVEASLVLGETYFEPATGADSEGPWRIHLPYNEARARLLHDFEREYIEALLKRCGGNVSRAARQANMNRSHLTNLIKQHQLR